MNKQGTQSFLQKRIPTKNMQMNDRYCLCIYTSSFSSRHHTSGPHRHGLLRIVTTVSLTIQATIIYLFPVNNHEQ